MAPKDIAGLCALAFAAGVIAPVALGGEIIGLGDLVPLLPAPVGVTAGGLYRLYQQRKQGI